MSNFGNNNYKTELEKKISLLEKENFVNPVKFSFYNLLDILTMGKLL